MCAEAKKVEELWDDQGAAFYYYDTVRNQSFHEPPKRATSGGMNCSS